MCGEYAFQVLQSRFFLSYLRYIEGALWPSFSQRINYDVAYYSPEISEENYANSFKKLFMEVQLMTLKILNGAYE